MINLLRKLLGLGGKAKNLTSLEEDSQTEQIANFTQKSKYTAFKGSIRHFYSYQRISQHKTCPRCDSKTERKVAVYACATNSIPQLIISDAAHFCTNCRTAIVDGKILQRNCEKGKIYRGIIGLYKKQRAETYDSFNDYIVRYSYDQNGTPVAMKLTNQKAEKEKLIEKKSENSEKSNRKKPSRRDNPRGYNKSREKFQKRTNRKKTDFKDKHQQKRTFKPKSNQKPRVENPNEKVANDSNALSTDKRSARESKPSERRNLNSKRRTQTNRSSSRRNADAQKKANHKEVSTQKETNQQKSPSKRNTNTSAATKKSQNNQTKTVQNTGVENSPASAPKVEQPQPATEKSKRLVRLRENQQDKKAVSRRPRRNVRPPIELDLRTNGRRTKKDDTGTNSESEDKS